MFLFILFLYPGDGKLLATEGVSSPSLTQISLFNCVYGKGGVYLNTSPAGWLLKMPNLGIKLQKNGGFIHLDGYMLNSHFPISGLPDTIDFGKWAMLLSMGYNYKWFTGNIHIVKAKSSMLDMGAGIYYHHIILEAGWGIPAGFYASAGFRLSLGAVFLKAGVLIPGIKDVFPVLPKGDIGIKF